MTNPSTPTPKRWLTSQQLIEDLAKCDWKGWYTAQRLRFAGGPLTAIVANSVGANTFRAFVRLPHQPSVVFREWAINALSQPGSHRDALLDVASPAQYDSWLRHLTESLQSHWENTMGKPLSYGASRKLTNLLMKIAIVWSQIPAVHSAKLVNYLHVPLDSFAIQAMQNSLTAIPSGGRITRIPNRTSMSYIVDEARYNLFQRHIQTLAQAASVPPIALDVLAWDTAHSGRN